MSRAAPIRQQTMSLYRDFMRTAHSVSVVCGITNVGGLEEYARNRFRSVATRNKELKVRKKLIFRQLELVEGYTKALSEAPNHPPMVSMLQVLAANVGSPVYQRELEKGFVDYVDFVEQQRERHEMDEVQVAERQNKILQVALRQYGDSLCCVHDPTLTPEAVQERLSSSRAAVSIHSLHHGREDVYVEIDDELNKQVIYVKCEELDPEDDIERVEVTETERVRNTICHAEWYAVAERLFEAIVAETPLHRSRGTVVVGHGVGGAVALGVAIILQSQSYDIKNVISFGAPKFLENTLQRTVEAVSPIRVVISGDPRTDVPITGTQGRVFKHYGEILRLEQPEEEASDVEDGAGIGMLGLMMNEDDEVSSGTDKMRNASPSNAGKELTADANAAQSEEEESSTEKYSVIRYAEMLNDDHTQLDYGEGHEVWDDGDYSHGLKGANIAAMGESVSN